MKEDRNSTCSNKYTRPMLVDVLLSIIATVEYDRAWVA